MAPFGGQSVGITGGSSLHCPTTTVPLPERLANANTALCSGKDCRRTRVHSRCPRQMCRPHCVKHGGCPFHFEGQLSTSQITKLARTESSPFPSLIDTIGFGVKEKVLDVQLAEGPKFCGTSATFGFRARYLNEVLEDENSLQQITVPSPNLALGAPHAPHLTASSVIRLPSDLDRSTPRRPKITTQMNATWMREFKATSTGNTGSRNSGSRSRAPHSLVRRFNLVFWDNDVDSANLQIVEECPDWPHWNLTQFSGLDLLGSNLTTIQLFSPVYRVWMSIPLEFTHSLTTSCAILLRRAGISGVDEQRLIDLFVPISHRLFRSNMPLERSDIRQALKTVKHKGRSQDESDSDVNLPSLTSSPPRKRRRFGQAPITPTRFNQQVHITMPATPSSPNQSSIDASPHTMPISLSPNPFCVLPVQPAPLPLLSESSSKLPRWPLLRSAISVVMGFQKIDQLIEFDKANKITVNLSAHLHTVYGCHVPVNTFRDARTRWTKAPQQLRDYVLDPEQTLMDWSYLASRVPLKS